MEQQIVEEVQTVAEDKKVHIISEEIEPFPQEEIKTEMDVNYFAKECKKLKNTEGSIKKLLKNKKSAEWWTKCDSEGNTLMHIALKNSWYITFNELMGQKPSAIYTLNKEGKSPVSLFLEQKQTEDHMICFNVLKIFYPKLSAQMKAEIDDFVSSEENAYYKSIFNL